MKNIQFRSAVLEDVEALGRLFIDTFVHRDPMTAHLKLSDEEAMDYSRVIFPESIKDGLTILAVDSEKDKIIGFTTAFKEDIASDPRVVSRLSPRLLEGMADTSHVFDVLLKPLEERTDYDAKRCLTVMYAGVHADYTGHHLSLTLIEQLLKRAVALGFTTAISECTSARSQTQVERLGFTPINAVAYADFGVEAFTTVPGALVLSLKQLGKVD
ncbi:hypothetical protein [Eubacterium barkeri]|uniref:N-acetyltransferase domain-containing protein n=1 Tax=Eubacterium barkeri TaxID=1528 RepID=A0A1H3ATQ9_EUBBA|nr:hypothetical protein [Eubacterium barkeri]SDX32219.1 hypothetical protein SAMN04488579_101149 [Eubacterium barkeri]